MGCARRDAALGAGVHETRPWVAEVSVTWPGGLGGVRRSPEAAGWSARRCLLLACAQVRRRRFVGIRRGVCEDSSGESTVSNRCKCQQAATNEQATSNDDSKRVSC